MKPLSYTESVLVNVLRLTKNMLILGTCVWAVMTLTNKELSANSAIHNALLVGSVLIPLYVTGTLAMMVFFGGFVIEVYENNKGAIKWFLGVVLILLFIATYFAIAVIYRELVYEPILNNLQIPYMPGPKYW